MHRILRLALFVAALGLPGCKTLGITPAQGVQDVINAAETVCPIIVMLAGMPPLCPSPAQFLAGNKAVVLKLQETAVATPPGSAPPAEPTQAQIYAAMKAVGAQPMKIPGT